MLQFRYASISELVYLITMIIASAVFGITLPLVVIVLGNSIDLIINRASGLCTFNLTSISEIYCPPDITLTSVNFYTTMS